MKRLKIKKHPCFSRKKRKNFLSVIKKSLPQITSPPSSSDFTTKNGEKKFGYISLYHYFWLSVMLAGPEVGDHFILRSYNKVIPPSKNSNILWFSSKFLLC